MEFCIKFVSRLSVSEGSGISHVLNPKKGTIFALFFVNLNLDCSFFLFMKALFVANFCSSYA